MYLLKRTNKTFDIIAVNEIRICKETYLTSNVNLNNPFESTPTESVVGRTRQYLSNHLSGKPSMDLNKYIKKSSIICFY